MSQISFIVGNCHVSESYRSVIWKVINKLRSNHGKGTRTFKGYAVFKSLPKSERRLLLQCIINTHRENRALYDRVMSGRI